MGKPQRSKVMTAALLSPRSRRNPAAGVTLIEMMIALALVALISMAGLAVLDQVLRTQRGTEGRLERLSEQQRAMQVILVDFAMASPRSLEVSAAAVSLKRSRIGGSLRLRYRLSGGILHREIADEGGKALADQAILTGVDAITWRFLTPENSWSDIWPVDPTHALTIPANPRAIELVIALQGNPGGLRRVAPLPADLE
jgi:general secretion pathway protein J